MIEPVNLHRKFTIYEFHRRLR